MDSIVYTIVSNGGGVDGRDPSDKGGNVTRAYLDRENANKCPTLPWGKIVPIVVDLKEVAKEAMESLTPVQRLAVTTIYATNKR